MLGPQTEWPEFEPQYPHKKLGAVVIPALEREKDIWGLLGKQYSSGFSGRSCLKTKVVGLEWWLGS